MPCFTIIKYRDIKLLECRSSSVVECLLPKQKVAGSIPVSCSKENPAIWPIFNLQHRKLFQRTMKYASKDFLVAH